MATDSEGDSEGDVDPLCEAEGGAEFGFNISFPPADPPPSEEAGSEMRQATCVLDAVITEGTGTSMQLTCDEDGAEDQAYAIEFGAPEGEALALEEGLELSLDYEAWWGFEVGSGKRLELAVDGETVLLVYRDSRLNGGSCMESSDPPRVTADSWLERVGGELVSAGCEDAGVLAGAFGDVVVMPGEVGALPDSELRAVVEYARCIPESPTNYDNWGVTFAAWRHAD